MSDKNSSCYYISKPSDDTDLSKCTTVKAYCFSNSIEATGISYKSHIKTLEDLEKEKIYIQKHFDNLEKEIKKGITAKERLEQLNHEILERKKKYRNCGRGKSKSQSKTKSENMTSVRRSQKRYTLLSKENFSGWALCSTMTYQTPEYELKKVYQDFSKCREKLKYRFPNIAYLAIYEPHANGSWHIHMIYKNARGLTREVFDKVWPHGFTYIEEFSSLAAPYFVKSNRLHFYPDGARLYTASRNLKMPKAIEFSVDAFEKYVEKREMKCISTNAKTLYKVDLDGEKRVNHFVFKNYQK